MANQNPAPSNVQTYGVPIYTADWVSVQTVTSKIDKDQEKTEEDSESSSSRSCAVLSGGGGEGNSGIKNVILICRVDLDANTLFEEPVAKLVVGSDLPYRMAVHPREGGLISGFSNDCKLFGWESVMEPREGNEVGEVIEELRDVGQQLALAFNQEGSVFAAGGEDGTLRVFEWPSRKVLLNESKAHGSVKNLTFSESGKFLVSLGGPLCRVWEVSAAAAVASIAKEKDEMFAFCRFSVDFLGNEVLYIAANTERGVSIITCDTTLWKRKRSKLIKNNSMSAFNVSPDGKLLAIGAVEGHVLLIDAITMQPFQVVKKAHLGIVTALTFSPDSRGLVSVSFDSRARLTVISAKREKSRMRFLVLLVLFVLLYVVSYYFLEKKGLKHDGTKHDNTTEMA